MITLNISPLAQMLFLNLRYESRKQCQYELHQFCLIAKVPSQYISMAGFLYLQHCSETVENHSTGWVGV